MDRSGLGSMYSPTPSTHALLMMDHCHRYTRPANPSIQTLSASHSSPQSLGSPCPPSPKTQAPPTDRSRHLVQGSTRSRRPRNTTTLLYRHFILVSKNSTQALHRRITAGASFQAPTHHFITTVLPGNTAPRRNLRPAAQTRGIHGHTQIIQTTTNLIPRLLRRVVGTPPTMDTPNFSLIGLAHPTVPALLRVVHLRLHLRLRLRVAQGRLHCHHLWLALTTSRTFIGYWVSSGMRRRRRSRWRTAS
jgi:hypothetical protein